MGRGIGRKGRVPCGLSRGDLGLHRALSGFPDRRWLAAAPRTLGTSAKTWTPCSERPRGQKPARGRADLPRAPRALGPPVAHDLWRHEAKFPHGWSRYVTRFATGVEIIRARDRAGVFIDHGMGVVIGETARVGPGCLIYKGASSAAPPRTAGAPPTARPRRHRGSNACILGAIEIGDGARIGSGSVVVRPFPAAPRSSASRPHGHTT